MAADDVLWKNVEALKTSGPPVHKDGPAPSETAPKLSPTQDTLSPSRATTDVRSTDYSDPKRASHGRDPSTGANEAGRSAVSDNAGQTNGRTVDRTPAMDDRLLVQVPTRPARRRPERYAFQFWADQITRLKKLRQVLNVTKDPDDRTEIALSDLARVALDEYLDRQTGRVTQDDGAT